jgi:hypothetical protein
MVSWLDGLMVGWGLEIGDTVDIDWRYSGDTMETVRDSWRFVEIRRDTFEIQMPKPK